MTERRLPGGRSFGAVRVGDEVRRPGQPWTATVHSVLRHLEDAGFNGAPRARGFDDQGRERLTFLPGQTLGGTRPWPDWLRSDDALWQVGTWLGRLHDETATFRPAGDAVWFTGRPWQPGFVIAHLGFGDAADRRRRFHLLLDAYGYTGDRAGSATRSSGVSSATSR
jgi:hypothetical protein